MVHEFDGAESIKFAVSSTMIFRCCDRDECSVPAEDRNPSTGVQGNTILAGDIGGTDTRLALFGAVTGELKIVAEQSTSSRQCSRFALIPLVPIT